MKKPVLYIAPGLTIFLIGVLTLVSLTAFGHTPEEPTEITAVHGELEGKVVIVDQPSALIPTLTPAVRNIEGVTASVQVQRGTRWLSSWVAEGFGPATPPSGYFVPVDVAAVDPDQYREFLPEELKHHADALAGGSAILSSTSAKLRGIPDAGALTFNTGLAVPVAGVVDDRLTRNHEIVVPTEVGSHLALSRTYMVAALTPETDAAEVESQINGLVPPGQKARISGSAATGLKSPSDLLSMAELKSQLGEFSARPAPGRAIEIPQEWIDEHTVETTVPILKEQFRCHKVVVRQIAAAMAEVERQGLAHLVDTTDFGGCFSARNISAGPDSNLSRHSWGAAFDINVQGNLYGHQPTIDQRIVEIVERFGFSWGGRWENPDGMHFEFVGTHP